MLCLTFNSLIQLCVCIYIFSIHHLLVMFYVFTYCTISSVSQNVYIGRDMMSQDNGWLCVLWIIYSNRDTDWKGVLLINSCRFQFLMPKWTALYKLLLIQTNSHTKIGVQFLAQWFFSMWTRGAGDQTTNPMINIQLKLDCICLHCIEVEA